MKEAHRQRSGNKLVAFQMVEGWGRREREDATYQGNVIYALKEVVKCRSWTRLDNLKIEEGLGEGKKGKWFTLEKWLQHSLLLVFCQRPFMYLMRWPCGVCLLEYLGDELHFLIYICWIVYASLGWSLFDHDEELFLMCCWIQYANILLRIFTSLFIRDSDLLFSFLLDLCLILVCW